MANYYVSSAESLCYQQCGYSGSPTNVYYGIRKVGTNTYNCACLTRDVTRIAGGPDTTQSAGDPVSTWNCYNGYLNTPIDALNSNSDLMNYLKVNQTELTTVFSNPNTSTATGIPNICNTARTVNLVTVYLAAMFGVASVRNIVNNFVYDPTIQYKYPYQTNVYFVVFPPVNVAGYPGIEQAYWTLVMQYTASNEYYLRRNPAYWCADQVTILVVGSV